MDEYVASLPDDVRKRLMAQICRLAARAPLEAAEAYLNIRPYKEHHGGVYTHLRPNHEVLDNAADVPDDEELDWVDLKVGKAENIVARRNDYEAVCVGEPIIWGYYYETSHPKLIERLTHLTLWAMDAKRVPYPCHGCGVRHREHFSEAKSGGLDVVAAVIEYWLGRLGEQAHASSEIHPLSPSVSETTPSAIPQPSQSYSLDPAAQGSPEFPIHQPSQRIRIPEAHTIRHSFPAWRRNGFDAELLIIFPATFLSDGARYAGRNPASQREAAQARGLAVSRSQTETGSEGVIRQYGL
ncbi:hypothetical protein C8R47DRAFT_1207905 [Mycena vitilis]|nr:hypothetical protein C8R47DRAFT_1207905 [Mycena vitilis]